MIDGRLFLFIGGLSDINFSSVDFNSFRHDVSDMTADMVSVLSVMVTVNLYLRTEKICKDLNYRVISFCFTEMMLTYMLAFRSICVRCSTTFHLL